MNRRFEMYQYRHILEPYRKVIEKWVGEGICGTTRTAINEARAEYAEGREMPFDEAAVERITTIGRRQAGHRNGGSIISGGSICSLL